MRYALTVIALLLGFATIAEAKCAVTKFNFLLGQAVSASAVTDGTACHIRLNNSRSPIHGVEIRERPKHGAISVQGRTTVVYSATAGFSGQDSFTFQWVGLRGGTTPEAATINVAVQVR